MKAPAKLVTANQGAAHLNRQLLHLVFSEPLALQTVSEIAEKANFKPFELPGQKGNPPGPAPIVNHSTYAVFVQKASGELSEKDYNALYDAFGGHIETVNPVYFRKEEEYETYFSPRIDTLVLAKSVAGEFRSSTSKALEKARLVVDELRTRYLSGKVVVRSESPREFPVLEQAARLQRYADIDEVYFEQSPLISPITATPNDPLYTGAWHLPQIEWNADLVGCTNTTVVAVIDQGVDLKHPDLNFASPGIRLNTMTPDGSPTGSHGTPCAGIAAAIVNNNEGVAGIAGGDKILPLAIASWSDLQIANGINYAATFGADVISMSFGVYASWKMWNFDLIDPEILFADNQGTFMCAATGNENRLNEMRYPSIHPLVLSVGGSNQADRRKSKNDSSPEPYWGACYGEEVYKGNPVAINVVAPCNQIHTTDILGGSGYDPGDYHLRFNGTSSATPMVAGLAALIKSRYPNAGNSTVKRIIEQSADKVGGYTYSLRNEFPNSAWNSEMGHGRINVRRALKLAKELLANKGDNCCTGGQSAPASGKVIAFSTVGGGHASQGQDRLLVEYKTIHTNEGDGFRKNDFVAPVEGVYEFNWDFVRDTLYHQGTQDDVSVYMKVNGKTISGAAFAGQIFDGHARATGAASLILRLKDEDAVTLWVKSDNGYKRHVLSFHFSGHLIAGV